jgi:uncharacterized protein
MKKKKQKKIKNLKDVLTAIRDNQENLKKLKIRHLTVFGSFARGDQKDKSDVDLLIEFTGPVGFFHFYDVKVFLEGLLSRRVDLVVKDAIKPEIYQMIKKDMIRAA